MAMFILVRRTSNQQTGATQDFSKTLREFTQFAKETQLQRNKEESASAAELRALTVEIRRANDLETERIAMRKSDQEAQHKAIGALAETVSKALIDMRTDISARDMKVSESHSERFKLLADHVDLIPKQVENTVGSAITLYLAPFINEWSDIKGVINRIATTQENSNKLLVAQIAELRSTVEASERRMLSAVADLVAQIPKPAAEVLPVGPSITVVPEPPKVGSTTTSEVKA